MNDSDKRVVVTILGEDGPGIIYQASRAFCQLGCNVIEVAQTILQTEFAGLFMLSMPEGVTRESLLARLQEELADRQLTITAKQYRPPAAPQAVISDPLVITLRGPDRLGIIPDITGVIAGFDVNVENLKAIPQSDAPDRVVLAFEVAVPRGVHHPALREALRFKADELGMEISIQHRDIFEAIHRVP